MHRSITGGSSFYYIQSSGTTRKPKVCPIELMFVMSEKRVTHVEHVKIIHLWCSVWKGVDKVELSRANSTNSNKAE